MPMKGALEFWQAKTAVTKAEFDALSGAARSRAFTVTGLARQSQISEVMAAFQTTLNSGGTLAQFKKELGPLLESRGWTGKKAWRVNNIFRTNVQSAYMAGRYQEMKEASRTRPYWRYSAILDGRTRPSHAALHGLVYEHDHPFWDSYYPPNGFGCRCAVQTLSRRQVEKRGEKIQTENPGSIRLTDSTGMETFVNPVPDAGWSSNIGKDWLAGLEPRELQGKARSLASAAICRSGQFADHDPCRPPLEKIEKRHIHSYSDADLLPKAMSKEEQVSAFLGEFGVTESTGSTIHMVPGGYPLVISKGLFVNKATGALKTTWKDRGPYMRLLAQTIKNPYEVWWQPVEIGPKKRLVYSLHLLRLFRRENSNAIGGYCSFSLLGGNYWLGATAFVPKAGRGQTAIYEYLEGARGGISIFRDK